MIKPKKVTEERRGVEKKKVKSRIIKGLRRLRKVCTYVTCIKMGMNPYTGKQKKAISKSIRMFALYSHSLLIF